LAGTFKLSNGIAATIRKGKRSDSDQIASLIFEWLRWKKERSPTIRDSIRAGEVVVAELKTGDKSLIGFVHGSVHNDPIHGDKRIFLTAFYVKPEYRGLGLGSALLKTLIDAAVLKHQILGVETSTMTRDAVKFYKKFGFVQDKEEIGEVFLNLKL